MSNKRYQSVIHTQSSSNETGDHWLRQFEEKLVKNSVQPANKNLFEQINSIMNGNSKYSSVQAKVEDMLERSGMSAYMSSVKASKEKDVHTKKTAEYKEAYHHGFDTGQFDLEHKQEGDIVASLNALHKKLSLSDAYQYGLGYCAGAGFDETTTDKELNTLRKVLEQAAKKIVSTAQQIRSDNNDAKKSDKEVEDPAMKILVFKQKPSIMNTLRNIIESSHGNLALPTIIDKLRSLHERDIADNNDWEQDDLTRYVSDQNLIAKCNNPSNYDDFNDLGRMDNSAGDADIDASNTDAFHALETATLT